MVVMVVWNFYWKSVAKGKNIYLFVPPPLPLSNPKKVAN